MKIAIPVVFLLGCAVLMTVAEEGEDVAVSKMQPWNGLLKYHSTQVSRSKDSAPDSDHYCSFKIIKTLDELRVYTLNVDRSDGNVYLASFEYDKLISYDGSGTNRRWEADVPRPRGVVASNGYIYVNSISDRKIFVFSSQGTNLGSFDYGITACQDIDGVVTGSDTIALYCINRDDRIYSFDAKGKDISLPNGGIWGKLNLGSQHGGIAAIQDPLNQRLLVTKTNYNAYEVIKVNAHDRSIVSRFSLNAYPEGIFVDEYGYPLIAGEKKIQLYGPGDDFRCEFPTYDLPHYSSDVVVGTDGVIWVASWYANKIWLLY